MRIDSENPYSGARSFSSLTVLTTFRKLTLRSYSLFIKYLLQTEPLPFPSPVMPQSEAGLPPAVLVRLLEPANCFAKGKPPAICFVPLWLREQRQPCSAWGGEDHGVGRTATQKPMFPELFLRNTLLRFFPYKCTGLLSPALCKQAKNTGSVFCGPWSFG